MYTKAKATAIHLNSDDEEALKEALDGAGEDNDGNPVFEVYDGDGDLLGSVVFHAGTEASDLTD